MWTDGNFYRDCVKENGKLRDLTEEERMLEKWCIYFTHDYTKNKIDDDDVNSIRYANFEMKPYEAEWFKGAKTAFVEKMRKKKTYSKRDIRMILSLGLDVGDLS